MDDIREHQANKHVSNRKPPADEETRKKLLELKLIPNRWEQAIFDKRWLPIAMLAPIGGLFLIGLVEDTYYYLEYFRNRGMSFQLFKSYFSLDAIYVSFALLVMVLVCLFQRFVKQAPSALCRLWRNRVISPRAVTGDTDATSTLVDWLAGYEAALLDRKRFLFMGVVLLIVDFVLVNHIKDALSLATFPDATRTLFLVFKWVIFPDLWLWIVLTAGWPALATAYFVRRLPQQIDLKVISSHPDQCGGLKPIGDICLQLALIVVIASIVLAYWGSIGRVLRTAGVLPRLSDEKVEEVVERFLPETLEGFKDLFDPTREGQPITRGLANLGTIAGIVAGGWLFLYPVLGIHELMKDKKAEFAQALADVVWEFDIELEQSIRAKDGRKIKEAHEKLEALQHSYSLLQDYPVWPISRRNFVMGFVAPQFLTVIGAILNVNTEIVDSLLAWIRQLLLARST